jgi:hypothetical protein
MQVVEQTWDDAGAQSPEWVSDWWSPAVDAERRERAIDADFAALLAPEPGTAEVQLTGRTVTARTPDPVG